MEYRKISARKIFDGYRFLQNQVLVLDQQDRIEDIIPVAEAGEEVVYHEGILTPGFVNCHCHLELSHMKGKIPEGTGLVDFVVKVVTERSATEEEILNAISRAEVEMKKAGIVAVGDICNNALTLPQKQKGNLHYYNFIEASGWLPAGAETRFERAKGLYEEYRRQDTGGRMMDASIVPHAPYSVSGKLWQAIQLFFAGKVASIHNQETPFEDEFFLQGTGDFTRMYELMNIDNSHHYPTKRTSLQSYFDKLSTAEKVILVHNTFITEEDVKYVKRKAANVKENTKPQTFFCLCVNANQYIERAMPPVEMLRKNECTIVLGTDSLASNHSLSIIDEIKTLRKYFPEIPLAEMLQWGTLNGARALGMDHLLGSFEKGKTPGVVRIDENELGLVKVIV